MPRDGTQIEARRVVLDRMLFLLSTGFPLPVLQAVRDSRAAIDISLLAYFVVEVPARSRRARLSACR